MACCAHAEPQSWRTAATPMMPFVPSLSGVFSGCSVLLSEHAAGTLPEFRSPTICSGCALADFGPSVTSATRIVPHV